MHQFIIVPEDHSSKMAGTSRYYVINIPIYLLFQEYDTFLPYNDYSLDKNKLSDILDHLV